jgi:hypothetical protein
MARFVLHDTCVLVFPPVPVPLCSPSTCHAGCWLWPMPPRIWQTTIASVFVFRYGITDSLWAWMLSGCLFFCALELVSDDDDEAPWRTISLNLSQHFTLHMVSIAFGLHTREKWFRQLGVSQARYKQCYNNAAACFEQIRGKLARLGRQKAYNNKSLQAEFTCQACSSCCGPAGTAPGRHVQWAAGMMNTVCTVPVAYDSCMTKACQRGDLQKYHISNEL